MTAKVYGESTVNLNRPATETTRFSALEKWSPFNRMYENGGIDKWVRWKVNDAQAIAIDSRNGEVIVINYHNRGDERVIPLKVEINAFQKLLTDD
jgi:hypothetical protein